MPARRQKKSKRQMGSGTYGWGKNKHRNSGQRGGYGNAGSGKKSHGKKPSYWAKEDYMGRFGFVSKGQVAKAVSISLRDISDKLPGWVASKQAKLESGVATVDLGKLGYTKLLSTGKLTTKVKITVPAASASAAEKVKAAGGELVVSQ